MARRVKPLDDMPRPSLHREPAGVIQIARHYIRDMVYGANDGIITTFAVVAGVTGERSRRAPCSSSAPPISLPTGFRWVSGTI